MTKTLQSQKIAPSPATRAPPKIQSSTMVRHPREGVYAMELVRDTSCSGRDVEDQFEEQAQVLTSHNWCVVTSTMHTKVVYVMYARVVRVGMYL